MTVKVDTPPPMDQPEAAVGYSLSGVGLTLLIAQVFGAQDRLLSRFLSPYGLTRPRATILRILDAQPNKRLPLNEISKHMKVTTTNITKLVDRLEQSGFLERVPSETDRRVLFAQLTPKGQALETMTRPRVAQFMDEVWSILTTDEQKQLGDLLAKIGAELERLNGGETV
jgi:MarR family 2-MHQ and catechol resistance regulon transcriptional repressor